MTKTAAPEVTDLAQPDLPQVPDEMTVPIRVRFARVLASVGAFTRDQTADTGKYEYKYADINQLLHMLKPILARHGLAISQPIDYREGHVMVTTELTDVVTGEVLAFPGPVCPAKGDPQALGSAITYFRRYAVVSLFALEAADDDGRAAHVQDTAPGQRTEAEAECRRLIAALPDQATRNTLIADFKAHFGVALLDLPTHRHGDALGWTKRYIAGEPEPAEQPEPTEATNA